MILLDTNVISELMRPQPALAHGASLATRDGADFADLGIALINPWTVS